MNDTAKVFIMVTLILLEGLCLAYLVSEIIFKLKRGRRPLISFQPEPSAPAPEFTWPRPQVDSSEPEQTPMLNNSVGDETDDNDEADDDDELFGVFHDKPQHAF